MDNFVSTFPGLLTIPVVALVLSMLQFLFPKLSTHIRVSIFLGLIGPAVSFSIYYYYQQNAAAAAPAAMWISVSIFFILFASALFWPSLMPKLTGIRRGMILWFVLKIDHDIIRTVYAKQGENEETLSKYE